MKKALIIGGAGFVGRYLADHIQSSYGWELHITKMRQERLELQGPVIHELDIMEAKDVKGLLRELRPDYIFHLAAQSSVALSWMNPQLTVDVNIKGSIHLLEALKQLELCARTLLIGSSEEYGRVQESESPVSEESPLRPGNIYAVTKVCQNLLGKIYADAYGLNIIGIRAFNHIGPGQTETFVVSDFCKQVAEIESGVREPIIWVGDLSAQRDFTDVREIVKAYVLLAIKGFSGETYNVGSGVALSIQELLEMILEKSWKNDIMIKIDPNKIRPIEVPTMSANLQKLDNVLGWQPEHSLDKAIEETLGYWRNKLSGEKIK